MLLRNKLPNQHSTEIEVGQGVHIVFWWRGYSLHIIQFHDIKSHIGMPLEHPRPTTRKVDTMSQDKILEVTVTTERSGEPPSSRLIIGFGSLTRDRDDEIRRIMKDEFGIEGNGDTLELIGRALHGYIGQRIISDPSYDLPNSIVFSTKDGWRASALERNACDFLGHRLELRVAIMAPPDSGELGYG